MDTPVVKGTLSLSNRGAINNQPGRSAVLIVGVVSMPDELAAAFSSMSWDQRLVTGSDLMEEVLMLHVERDVVDDLKDKVPAGARVDQLVTSPIWRI